MNYQYNSVIWYLKISFASKKVAVTSENYKEKFCFLEYKKICFSEYMFFQDKDKVEQYSFLMPLSELPQRKLL